MESLVDRLCVAARRISFSVSVASLVGDINLYEAESFVKFPPPAGGLAIFLGLMWKTPCTTCVLLVHFPRQSAYVP